MQQFVAKLWINPQHKLLANFILIAMSKKYKVLGAEGEAVEIDGVSHAVGAEVELEDEAAESLVSEGKVEEVVDAGADDSADEA